MGNILILSAGRRVELVEAFKGAVSSRALNIGVFAEDMHPLISGACYAADKAFQSVGINSPDYPDFLLKRCLENGITLVIPTIDTGLCALANQRERFAISGVNLILSSPELVTVCRDKRLSATLFSSIGIDTPQIYERTDIRYPAFAKPYDGSRSIGAAEILTSEQLTMEMMADEKLIFMELISGGAVEYTVDVYYDRGGVMRCLVPRQRLEVRTGEVSKGITRRDEVYDYLLPRLEKISGARGCLTVQLFVNHTDGRFCGIEINPRFGGGYPLTHAAGADYAGWLIDEYMMGRSCNFFDSWSSNLLMLRYDAKKLVQNANV